MKLGDTRSLLRQTFNDWMAHSSQTMGASLAYFTVLSLSPLLVIAVAIAGLVFGKAAVQGLIVSEMRDLVGTAGAQTIQNILIHAKSLSSGLLASLLGLITLFFGAAGVFNELRNALNKIWNVNPQSSGLMGIVKDELRSFGLVVGIGFLLLVSLLVSTVLTAISRFAADFLPLQLLWSFNVTVSLVVITILFAVMYRVVPATNIPWSDVWIGALATAILFTLGKLLIGLYLGNASIGSAYGAAGSLVVLLVWVYYSAQIFLFGAEFTHVYSMRKGSRHRYPKRPPVEAREPQHV